MAVKTYGTLILNKDNKWQFEVEPHVAIRLKNVFKAIGTSRQKHLTVSNTVQNCRDIEWFISRYRVKMSAEDLNTLTSSARRFDTEQEEREEILLPSYVPKKVELALPLRKYQEIGVDFVLKTKKTIIGDDVGLGKTAQAIGAMISAGSFPALVVCQTHLPTQWEEQIKKFAPSVTVHIINKLKMYNLPPADIYVMSYSKLRGWHQFFFKDVFRFTVFDECQELRLSGSSKYEAASALSERAEYVVGLSATPIYNFGDEIFYILDVIKPGCLGEKYEFLREWGTEMYGGSVKVNDPKALGAYLREHFLMLRRMRKEVDRELPPINKIVHEVEYSQQDHDSMEDTLRHLAARYIDSEPIKKGEAAMELNMRARMMTGVAKAKGVADYVRDILANGEKVLLAGWHRETYRIWMEELREFNPVLYTGSESPEQKNKAKEEFVKGKSQLMIISLRSGVGLDGLQDVCRTVVFGELDWSPGVHRQIEGRVNRDKEGEANHVTSIYLTMDGGTDPLMIDLLGLKGSQAEGIVNLDEEDENLATVEENRTKLLAERLVGKQG